MRYFFIILLFSVGLNAQQLAFPSAIGAGAYATGGRGGQVIHVTTLDWDAPGGLKEAIQTTGARTIVFDVSGEIDASQEGGFSTIIDGSSFDNLTIAGQTAPEGGITIRTSEFRFGDVDNIIVRFIRFRWETSLIGQTYSQDAFAVLNGQNIIFDHCTFSHGNDESASWANSINSMTNVTIQNCFFQDSKTGSIIGVSNDAGDFSFVNNVYTNISHRFPNSKSDGQVDIIGNVTYNWKERLVRLGDNGTYNGQANIINNYYKGAANGIHQPGWFSGYNIPIERLHRAQLSDASTGQIYTAGSYIYIQRATPQTDDSDMWSVFDGSSLTGVAVDDPVPASFFVSTPFTQLGESFTIDTAENYYNDLVVEGDVGAYKTLDGNGNIVEYRDTRDTERLNEIINDSYNGGFYDSVNTYGYPTIPQNTRAGGYDTDGDGMPDVWETATFGDLSRDGTGDLDGDGYTDLDEFLNLVDGTTPTVNVTGVTLSQSTASITTAQTLDLDATVSPVDATDKSGTWASSNNSVATIDQNGLVTPVTTGSTTISFTTNDGTFTDTCVVTVTEAPSGGNGKTKRGLKAILISNN